MGVVKFPPLRFKAFDDSWTVTRIGEVCIKVGSGSTPNGGEKVYTESGIPFIRSQNVHHNNLVMEGVSFIPAHVHHKMKGSAVLPNDILLNITGASIGRSCLVPTDFVEGNVNQHVCIIRVKPDIEPRFLQAYISSFNGQMAIQRSQVGSGREGLNFHSIRMMPLCLPSLGEQQKIASYLTAVDAKIQQLTKKKMLLEQYKKGVMQQLFSQQLRFRDDQGNAYHEWETRKLGDLFQLAKSGGTPTSTKPEYYNGEIPFLSISDMTRQGKYLTSTTSQISALGLNNSAAWVVPANSIIYSMYASVGFVAINLIPLATSQAVLNLIPHKKYCTEFLYYCLLNFQDKTIKFITTGTQGNLNAQTVKAFQLDIPYIEEQTRIASFLSAIDDKISAVGKQIEQTRQFKKGLLQQMFV